MKRRRAQRDERTRSDLVRLSYKARSGDPVSREILWDAIQSHFGKTIREWMGRAEKKAKRTGNKHVLLFSPGRFLDYERMSREQARKYKDWSQISVPERVEQNAAAFIEVVEQPENDSPQRVHWYGGSFRHRASKALIVYVSKSGLTPIRWNKMNHQLDPRERSRR